jgi:tryptophanyl-tRNA synthetase
VVWQLYAVVAGHAAAAAMAEKLRAGGYGWGHAKKELLEATVDGFAAERAAFAGWMSDPSALEAELQRGADRARAVASDVLARTRSRLGF